MARRELAGKVKEVRTLTETLAGAWSLALDDPLRWETSLEGSGGLARLMVAPTEPPVYRLNFLSTPDADSAFYLARFTYLGSGIIASVLRTNFAVDELLDNIGAIDERLQLQREGVEPAPLLEYDNLLGMLREAPTAPSQG